MPGEGESVARKAGIERARSEKKADKRKNSNKT